jgi:hypothetical protein
MKLTAIGLLKWNGPETAPIFLGCATDVSNFGYFQVGTAAHQRHSAVLRGRQIDLVVDRFA